MMLVVPSLIALTIPVVALMVATDGFELLHCPFISPSETNVDVVFLHIVLSPEIVPGFTAGLTTKVPLFVKGLPQPEKVTV